MVCLGIEPGAAEWKVRTNPLSYGSTPDHTIIDCVIYGDNRGYKVWALNWYKGKMCSLIILPAVDFLLTVNTTEIYRKRSREGDEELQRNKFWSHILQLWDRFSLPSYNSCNDGRTGSRNGSPLVHKVWFTFLLGSKKLYLLCSLKLYLGRFVENIIENPVILGWKVCSEK